MVEFLQYAVTFWGLATLTTAIVLAIQVAKTKIRTRFRRALVFELVAKAAATLATLVFSVNSVARMETGADGWNAIGVGEAIVLRLLIFGPAFASSVYLMSVIHSDHETQSEINDRIAKTLAEGRRRNVEPDIR